MVGTAGFEPAIKAFQTPDVGQATLRPQKKGKTTNEFPLLGHYEDFLSPSTFYEHLQTRIDRRVGSV